MAGADRPSKWKFPVIFFGALLGLALLFQLVESLLPEPPTVASAPAEPGIAASTDSEAGAVADPEAEMQGPVRPTLTRTDEETIEIGLGFMRRSRYIFEETDKPEQVDAFHACLEKGFGETFDSPEWNPSNPGPADRSALRRRMKTVVREIADDCMGASFGLPSLPLPPEPPGDS